MTAALMPAPLAVSTPTSHETTRTADGVTEWLTYPAPVAQDVFLADVRLCRHWGYDPAGYGGVPVNASGVVVSALDQAPRARWGWQRSRSCE